MMKTLEHRSIFFVLYIVCLTLNNTYAQTNTLYTAYQTAFRYVTTCPSAEYYDIALLQCSPCPNNTKQSLDGSCVFLPIDNRRVLVDIDLDKTQCDCIDQTFYYVVNQGGGSLICASCPSGYVR
jgi:hypothetical protein